MKSAAGKIHILQDTLISLARLEYFIKFTQTKLILEFWLSMSLFRPSTKVQKRDFLMDSLSVDAKWVPPTCQPSILCTETLKIMFQQWRK